MNLVLTSQDISFLKEKGKERKITRYSRKLSLSRREGNGREVLASYDHSHGSSS